MLDAILIVMLILSLSKPDILLSKKLKEKANDEQKTILVKNLRILYSLMIALFESIALLRISSIQFIMCIVLIILFVLFFIIGIPAIKENSTIKKELQ